MYYIYHFAVLYFIFGSPLDLLKFWKKHTMPACFNVVNCRKKFGQFPDVFYIGLGKTGSSSISYGFPNHIVAHWHNDKYFRKLNGIDSLKGYKSLYDYIFTNCIRHNIRPLIIESFRDIVSMNISTYFQHNSKRFIDTMDYKEYYTIMSDLDQWHYSFRPHSELLLKEGYVKTLETYQENDYGKFAILKFEEINKWQPFFESIGYKYIDNHENHRENKIYDKVLKDFKIEKNRLLKIYDNEIFTKFYSDLEIDIFVNRWKK